MSVAANIGASSILPNIAEADTPAGAKANDGVDSPFAALLALLSAHLAIPANPTNGDAVKPLPESHELNDPTSGTEPVANAGTGFALVTPEMPCTLDTADGEEGETQPAVATAAKPVRGAANDKAQGAPIASDALPADANVIALPKSAMAALHAAAAQAPEGNSAPAPTPQGVPDARPMGSIMASIASAVRVASFTAPKPAEAGAPTTSAKTARPVASVSVTTLPARPIAQVAQAANDNRSDEHSNETAEALAAPAPANDLKPAPSAHSANGLAAAGTESTPAVTASHSQPANGAIASTSAPQPTDRAEAPMRLPAQAGASHADVSPEIEALALRIAAKSAQGARRFDIRLDPPELGRIDVRLDVNHDGRAQAQLSADKPQTLDLLQRDHRSLERALKDAGLDLGSMSFSLRGEERQPLPTHARQQDGRRETAPGAPVSTPAVTLRWYAKHDATVDIRV